MYKFAMHAINLEKVLRCFNIVQMLREKIDLAQNTYMELIN